MQLVDMRRIQQQACDKRDQDALVQQKLLQEKLQQQEQENDRLRQQAHKLNLASQANEDKVSQLQSHVKATEQQLQSMQQIRCLHSGDEFDKRGLHR